MHEDTESKIRVTVTEECVILKKFVKLQHDFVIQSQIKFTHLEYDTLQLHKTLYVQKQYVTLSFDEFESLHYAYARVMDTIQNLRLGSPPLVPPQLPKLSDVDCQVVFASAGGVGGPINYGVPVNYGPNNSSNNTGVKLTGTKKSKKRAAPPPTPVKPNITQSTTWTFDDVPPTPIKPDEVMSWDFPDQSQMP